MNYLKTLGLAALSAIALMAFASTASATTLEVGGVTKNESLTVGSSIKAGTSLALKDTFGFFANTCTESIMEGSTDSPYTGTTVTEGIDVLTFGSCDHTVTVHSPGTLHVEWTSGTNGRVSSSGAEVTVYSIIHGTHINCKTGTGTLLGTLTGSASGYPTIDINATLNCGPHLNWAKWTGIYTLTFPTGLGVSS